MSTVEFNIELIKPISWNGEAFKSLALDPDRRILVQSLVESHSQHPEFDDFVTGKGRGLVINLFGTPVQAIFALSLVMYVYYRSTWSRENPYRGSD
jgi:hypothetical protein